MGGSSPEILSALFLVGFIRWLPASVGAMKESASTASQNLNTVLSSPKASPPEIQLFSFY